MGKLWKAVIKIYIQKTESEKEPFIEKYTKLKEQYEIDIEKFF